MKISKKVSCEDCPLKCDIYKTLVSLGRSLDEVNPIHAHFRKNEMICKQNCAVTHAVYLISGTAKLFIEGLNNRNIILYIMKPPSYIGLLSFFESVHYSYSVTAIEESDICMIDLNFLKDLYVDNHELLIKLNKAFGKSVASIMRKLITLNQKHIRGRVAESLLYLKDLYQSDTFTLPLTRKELGELSAISEENTVRILSEFRNENIIFMNGREVKINDHYLLSKISDLG